MISHVTVTDITMTDDFLRDYERSPKHIKARINRLIEMMAGLGKFPTSMRVRPTFLGSGLVMGNVTQKRQAYRVLFWLDENTGLVTLHRLLSHDERDEYLRVE